MEVIEFGSICSGIEAASVALEPIGFKAAWFAEINAFPAAVLAHHYPNTPNHGDMRKLPAMVLSGHIPAPEVLIGGTPCQAFSVAGLREGLRDPRGELTIKYVELADAVDLVRTRRGEPECIIKWENVPGVLSDKENAFGCFLAALVGESEALEPSGKGWTDAGCVYGPRRAVAWRILDAQYFGLAQRRRRVFLVASARKGFDPASVLFESEGVRRDSPPSRKPAENIAGTLEASIGRSRGAGISPGSIVAGTLDTKQRADRGESANLVVATLDASYARLQGCSGQDLNHGHSHLIAFGQNNTSGSNDISHALNANRGCYNPGDFEAGTLLVCHGTQDPDINEDLAHTLGRNHGQENALLAFDTTQITSPANRSNPQPGDPCHPLSATGHAPAIAESPSVYSIRTANTSSNGWGVNEHTSYTLDQTQGQCVALVHPVPSVRRLTPTECERLQGFPDNYTFIPTWDGWRPMDTSETPESCVADGLQVRQSPKTKAWRVKDVDGPRYQALGNSKAVPVVRWVGLRLRAAMGHPL